MAANIHTLPSIDDLPMEIIEKLAPDLRPKTISTLRLVSPRFYTVFSADRFYRYYLLYPDNNDMYKRDLEEIGDKVGKWRLCLEAEKQRLLNWKNGRPRRVDTVEIPIELPIPFPYSNWQGKTWEGNNHWMLSECRNQKKIILLNITEAPILAVLDVSSFTSKASGFALLLPDRVLIDSGNSSKRVFTIKNDGNKLSLEFLFIIEPSSSEDAGLSISGKSKVTHTHRSLYLSYTKSHQFMGHPIDAVLRVWDLKTAVELEKIDLIELILPKFAFNLSQNCNLEVCKSEFPHIIVSIKFKTNGSRKAAVLVVNVEERRLVLWFDEEKHQKLCYSIIMKENTVCLYYCDPASDLFVVRVYDLNKSSDLEDNSGILFQYESKGNTLTVRWEPPMLIISHIYKIKFIRIDSSEVSQREIDMRCILNIDIVIGPFLIVSKLLSISSLDMTGKTMFDWDGLIPGRRVVDVLFERNERLIFVKDVDFLSLSKCVLKNRRSNYLYICYF